MVAGQLSRGEVDDEKLLPVGTRAGDGIGGIFPVVGEIDSLEGYRTIGTEFVGVEEYPGLLLTRP